MNLLLKVLARIFSTTALPSRIELPPFIKDVKAFARTITASYRYAAVIGTFSLNIILLNILSYYICYRWKRSYFNIT